MFPFHIIYFLFSLSLFPCFFLHFICFNSIFRRFPSLIILCIAFLYHICSYFFLFLNISHSLFLLLISRLLFLNMYFLLIIFIFSKHILFLSSSHLFISFHLIQFQRFCFSAMTFLRFVPYYIFYTFSSFSSNFPIFFSFFLILLFFCKQDAYIMRCKLNLVSPFVCIKKTALMSETCLQVTGFPGSVILTVLIVVFFLVSIHFSTYSFLLLFTSLHQLCNFLISRLFSFLYSLSPYFWQISMLLFLSSLNLLLLQYIYLFLSFSSLNFSLT